MAVPQDLEVVPIGVVESTLRSRARAPKQGSEGAPDAWIVVRPEYIEGLHGIAAGDEVVVLTWLHLARRDTLRTHPRDDPNVPEQGVFNTRSPDRPNPIGLHRVRVLDVQGNRIHVTDLEAVDATPVVDLKPVLPSDR